MDEKTENEQTLEEIKALRSTVKQLRKQTDEVNRECDKKISEYVAKNASQYIKNMTFYMSDYHVRHFKDSYRYSFEPIQLRATKKDKAIKNLLKQFDMTWITFSYGNLDIQINVNAYDNNSIGLDIRRKEKYDRPKNFEEENEINQLEYLTEVMNFLNEYNIVVLPSTYKILMEQMQKKVEAAQKSIKEYEETQVRNQNIFSLISKYIFRAG